MLDERSEVWNEVDQYQELEGELEGMDGNEIVQYLDDEGYIDD